MSRVKCTGEHKTWSSFCRDLSGYYLQPVGFEELVNHLNTNVSRWRVERLFYNGQYFMSVEELWDAYSTGTVDKIVKTLWEDYGSLKPRTRPLQLGPQLMSPEGARYSVRHNQVLYLDWSFAFGLSAVTGMRVFDVRFRNEHILYELSVQEAMSVYGSVTPGMGMTKFLDSSLRLDYCNSLLTGLSKRAVKQLQYIQNAAAPVLTKTRKYNHISPVLRSLHWLPVTQRIDFKTVLLVFKSLHGLAPKYISDMLVRYEASRTLRTSGTGLLLVPRVRTKHGPESGLTWTRVRTKHGESAFQFYAAQIWNSLPVTDRPPL
ncbi:hypothetical protein WMY93_033597 [Mugilogobius chulae]|uniref:Amine oxidase n=1 Tax=Mugilogobius chulae TaxID=88201 RepID=A0AAW0MND4_9GOBI